MGVFLITISIITFLELVLIAIDANIYNDYDAITM